MEQISQSPFRPFQPRPIFMGKDGAYSRGGALAPALLINIILDWKDLPSKMPSYIWPICKLQLQKVLEHCA